MKETTKSVILAIVLSILSIVLIFFSGIIWNCNLQLAIILGVLGIAITILLILKSSNDIKTKITGNGVSTINVGHEEPEDAKEGDLWIDTKP